MVQKNASSVVCFILGKGESGTTHTHTYAHRIDLLIFIRRKHREGNPAMKLVPQEGGSKRKRTGK